MSGARDVSSDVTRALLTTLWPATCARGSQVLLDAGQPTHFTRNLPPFSSTIFSGTNSSSFLPLPFLATIVLLRTRAERDSAVCGGGRGAR